jgi:hypothetical protein
MKNLIDFSSKSISVSKCQFTHPGSFSWEFKQYLFIKLKILKIRNIHSWKASVNIYDKKDLFEIKLIKNIYKEKYQ